MIFDRASLSTLSGMNVVKESRAIFESDSARSQQALLGKTITAVLTLFADFEQLVGIPAHHASGQAAPAPLDNTGNDLARPISPPPTVAPGSIFPSRTHTMGSVIRSSWLSPSPKLKPSLLKKWRTKLRTALGSDVGRKGSRRKGRSRAVHTKQSSRQHICVTSSWRTKSEASPEIGRGGDVRAQYWRSIPRAFNSSVQRLISSCTSSASTVVRVNASSQRGFWASEPVKPSKLPPFFDLDLVGPSLPLRREKKLGMACLAWSNRCDAGSRKRREIPANLKRWSCSNGWQTPLLSALVSWAQNVCDQNGRQLGLGLAEKKTRARWADRKAGNLFGLESVGRRRFPRESRIGDWWLDINKLHG